jgi:hypothetical protein
MRPVTADDLLISRLQMLIVMAKAYMKGYPLGDYRRRAICRNARLVFNEATIRTGDNRTPNHGHSGTRKRMERLFLQRAQLLAVMLNAFVEGKSEGNFRSRAMAENVEHICGYLSDRLQLGDARFLKVA